VKYIFIVARLRLRLRRTGYFELVLPLPVVNLVYPIHFTRSIILYSRIYW
jgi:hypothetical protein